MLAVGVGVDDGIGVLVDVAVASSFKIFTTKAS
jgi:hypothetical protein